MELVSEEELEVLSKDSGIDIIDAIKGIPIDEKSWIPEDCGVYIITTTEGDNYVGASSNILIRIIQHHIKDIKTVDVYLTHDSQKLKLERWFIDQIEPSLNIVLYNKTKINDDRCDDIELSIELSTLMEKIDKKRELIIRRNKDIISLKLNIIGTLMDTLIKINKIIIDEETFEHLPKRHANKFSKSSKIGDINTYSTGILSPYTIKKIERYLIENKIW